MASIYDEIQATLETTLSNIAGIPSIAFDNITFIPTTGTSYIKSLYAPDRRVPAARGLNPQFLYTGLFALDVFVPGGLGSAEGNTIVNSIVDAFNPPNDIVVAGNDVTILYAERELGISEGAFYRIPVNIGWEKYS
jgi:hypothetical protein